MDARRLSIGLVEDNDEDFYALKRAFGTVGGTVRRWPRGEGLFKAILEDADLLGGLDLLVLDLGLPGSIDGVHIAHTIRGAPGGADLPIIVLSGSAAEPDIERALSAGVTEYEVKPGNYADLRALVGRTVELIAERGAPA